MSSRLDEIFLEEIELFGYIGVLESEKRDGQVFLIDVSLGLDLRQAGKSDMLAHTVNYAEVYDLAAQLMDEARCDLIEAYAEMLCEEIFKYFGPVVEATVTIRKPEAPIDGKLRAAGARIRRRRHE